jgi:hypothetical protein
MDEQTQQTQQQQQPSTPPQAWFGDEVKDYVGAKGWKNPSDVITSYQQIEKLQRTPVDRTVVLPEKPDDAEAWAKVHERLGRPASADKYQFEGYEPQDGDLVQGEQGFAAMAHKLGLSQAQAGELYKWYGGRSQEFEGQSEQMKAEAHTADLEKVRTAWGQAYDQKVSQGKMAASALGLGADDLQKIEDALGTEWLMNTMQRIGAQLDEGGAPPRDDTHVDDGGKFGLSPAEADQKLQELFRDDAFLKRYFEGDKDAMDRVGKLTQAIAGTSLVRPNALVAAR